MTVVATRTVRGYLADSETGAGLAGLRVEVWQEDGERLVATGESDEAGRFAVAVKPGSAGEIVEVRVVREGRVVQSDALAMPADADPEDVELTVPVSVGANRDEDDSEDVDDDGRARSAEVTG